MNFYASFFIDRKKSLLSGARVVFVVVMNVCLLYSKPFQLFFFRASSYLLQLLDLTFSSGYLGGKPIQCRRICLLMQLHE